MTVSLVLDVLGDQLGIWHYRFNVLPVLPSYFPWDITLMPVTIMFFSQVKPHVNPIIKAVLFTLLTSYISEPFIS
ncbi:CBO0543 family protein [Bacillus sp. DJP31]|uniref:CBO0543 family protein n=1 Tax=Bacillus sp. DJP31 TaxID=3409789 RepID=UPI003BB693DC